MWIFEAGRGRRIGPLGLLLLMTLSKRPLSGAECMHALDRLLGEEWAARKGTIYPILHHLRNNHYVEMRKAPRPYPGRAIFALTDKGRRLLHEALKDFPRRVSITARYLDVVMGGVRDTEELVRRIASRCRKGASPHDMLLLRCCCPPDRMKDEETLLAYRDFLLSELKRVEGRLKRRTAKGIRIPIE